MYYVYVLRSDKDGNWYVGYSSDLRKRLQEHARGENVSTSYRGHFELMYYEAYQNKQDATGRERFLKSGSGHIFLKKQLSHFLAGNQSS